MEIHVQVIEALKHIREAHPFIKTNTLWKGYFNQGWRYSVTILLAMLVGILFIMNILRSVESLSINDINSAASGLALIAENIYYDGGIKYLIFILLQMFIFHMSHRTLEVLTGVSKPTSWKDFYKVMVRGFKLAIRNFFMEIVTGTVISIILGILALSLFKSTALLFLQFYFIGYTYMDIYFYQGGLRVRETSKYIRHHAAAAIVIGAFGFGLFLIPLAGAFIAPLICSVAATTYLFYNTNREEESEAIFEGGSLAVD